MYVNLLENGVLLEEVAQGQKSLEIHVDADAEEVLRAMVRLGNEQISQALAKLFICGVNHGRTMPRKVSA